MRTFRLNLLILLCLSWSCSRWDYNDLSDPVDPTSPETYLSLVAVDTIYSSVDSLGNNIYAIDEVPDSGIVWDTLDQAFTTITTSRQELSWWGEDPDGNVIGYYYRWNTDSVWTYTDLESGVFYVPIETELDVFWFEVKALDDSGLEDVSPSKLVVPIKNSSPEISFRYLSNPQISDIGSDTSFTFPTRTFIWDLYDQDGNETITDIFYTLDDTCDTCWTRLDGDVSSITLTEIGSGIHNIYLKCQDIAGAESEIIFFPDSSNLDQAQIWKVQPVNGDILLVDDFPQDGNNTALFWYESILDTLVGVNAYSVWEIGDELPYSSTDVSANLNYFKNVIWFGANTGSETYPDAGASIQSFIYGGGNFFMNAPQYWRRDSTFSWFPLDSVGTINPNGRLYPNRDVHSLIDSTLDLRTSYTIGNRLKAIYPNMYEDGELLEDSFKELTYLYQMADPGNGDYWEGNPPVCAIGQFEVSPVELSGKVVLMVLPFHDGSQPVMDGNGSAGKFIKYLIEEEFTE